MPDWVAVAGLPSQKVRRPLSNWEAEISRSLLPDGQRTLHSYFGRKGARSESTFPEPSEARPAHGSSAAETVTPTNDVPATTSETHSPIPIGADDAEAPAALTVRNTNTLPTPHGPGPGNDLARGVVTAQDAEGRCVYKHARTGCCVIDDPGGFYDEGLLLRCERCAVGIHGECAERYANNSHEEATYSKHDMDNELYLCQACYDEHLPYADESDLGEIEEGYHPRRTSTPWWIAAMNDDAAASYDEAADDPPRPTGHRTPRPTLASARVAHSPPRDSDQPPPESRTPSGLHSAPLDTRAAVPTRRWR